MRGSSSGLAKTIQGLESLVEAGDYYEAQQKYKTRYARYVAGKKYDDALELLQSGASVQLRHGQVTCGTELGVLLIDTLRKGNVPFGSTALDRIRVIYSQFPRVDACHINLPSENGSISEESVAARTRVEGCTTFLKAAIKWSIDSGGPPRGAPDLHHMLADYIWTQSPLHELGKASVYYVRGSCPESFAAAVVDSMNKCYPCEADLVLTRAVLQYLSVGYLGEAKILWEKVKDLSADKFPDTPLLHFVQFLFQSLDRDALPLFKMLRQSYKPSINRDPTFDEYLDNVAEHFYNVQPPNGIQGMLGDIMKMFGEG